MGQYALIKFAGNIKAEGVADPPEDCASWKNCLAGTSLSSTKESAKSCTQGGTASTCWGLMIGKELCRKGSVDPGGHGFEHETVLCPCDKEG